MGVSLELFKQAARVHEIFTESPDYKAQMEPRILDVDHPVGLGAVIAGYAGKRATEGETPEARPALAHVCRTFADLTRRVAYWRELNPTERQEVKRTWRETLAKLPGDLVDLIADAAVSHRRQLTRAKGKPLTKVLAPKPAKAAKPTK